MVSAKTSWAREAPNAAAVADASGVRDAAWLVWVRWRVNLMPPAYWAKCERILQRVVSPTCHYFQDSALLFVTIPEYGVIGPADAPSLPILRPHQPGPWRRSVAANGRFNS